MAATTSTPQPVTALPSPEQLKGQVFVILGGSAGMGKAVARSALARGADVVLVSRTESKLAAAKDELVSQGADEARISTAAVDGSDEEAMKTLFAGYEKGSIHHLVATVSCWSLAKAGASSGGGKFLDHSFEHVQAQLDAKVKVQWLAARYAAPVLAQGGSITFFTGGLSIRPGTGSSLLAMANASLEALTKALANELGPAL
ncbi:PECR, partial [Symbiodinium sp. KB8]